MSIPHRLRAAARSVYRERVSRVYLGLVTAAMVFLLVDTAFVSHEDATFSGVWLVLLTLPWMPMFWRLFAEAGGQEAANAAYGWGAWWTAVLAALLSAVLNAAVLGIIARARKRRPQPR
ncbi:SCO4225 family membrane protein [Streptomyces sp. NPDC002574]|uniref:SCO4225 family membrane protein n=1 Tax=Streptomyces sp. NPDC002574 TaxID=3364652 RepID=UPI00367EBA56